MDFRGPCLVVLASKNRFGKRFGDVAEKEVIDSIVK
jgi:hypothetical protein